MEVDAERGRVVTGWGTVAAWVAGALAFAVVVFVLAGAERVWGLFGPADLGDIKFETLERRSSPNDALAMPEGFGAARLDMTNPVYAVPPQALRDAFGRALAGEKRLFRVAEDEVALTARYVQRTALLGFPDTIVVRFVAVGPERSSIALYSRSKFGYSDLGANKERLERWLVVLAREVPPVK